MSEVRRTAPQKAETRRSFWPGWIWSVPVAALGIGIWLLVRVLARGGTDITITFVDGAGVTPQDTAIEYRGVQVGTVTGVALIDDATEVRVSATVESSATKLLTTGTAFWLRGTHPSLGNLSSLGAILSGPTIVMQPGPGAAARHFTGLERPPAVPRDHGSAVPFGVSFQGSVGDLSTGDAVKLRGFVVGEVKQIGFDYDVSTGRIETPVTLALYPKLFRLPGGMSAGGFEAAVAELVSGGLRASIEREPPVIGGYRVALEMVPDAPPARLDTAVSPPQIPAAPGTGLESLVARVSKVPVDQIAQDVLDTVRHLDTVASRPELKDAVVQLDSLVREIRSTVGDIAPKVERLVVRLRSTAQGLDDLAETASRTLGGPTSQAGAQSALREIKEAARAVRALADYLDRHPEALIAGRGGG